MVITSVYWIYGFSLNETMINVLQKHGVITAYNELLQCAKYKHLCLIRTARDAIWSGYLDNIYYLGLCQIISFQSYEVATNKIFYLVVKIE